MGVVISDETKIRIGSLTDARALIEKVTQEKTETKFVDEIGGGKGPVLKNFYDIWIPPYGKEKGLVGVYFRKGNILYTKLRIKKKIEKLLRR